MRELEAFEAERQRAHELELARTDRENGEEECRSQEGFQRVEPDNELLQPHLLKFRSGEKTEPYIA